MIDRLLEMSIKDNQVVERVSGSLNPQEREELESRWVSVNGRMVKVVDASNHVGDKGEPAKWETAFTKLIGEKPARFLSEFMVYTLNLGGLLSDERHFDKRDFKERLVNEIFSLKSWQFKLLLMFLLKRSFGIYGFLPSLIFGGGMVAAKQVLSKIPTLLNKKRGIRIKGGSDE